MANGTRKEILDQLRNARDPKGRKTYLTVYANLRQGDWMQILKDRAESFRYGLSPDEAKDANVHHAFDKAFVAAERLANDGADAALLVMSPVNDLEIAQPLDRSVDTTLVLDDKPDLTQLS